jgi:hypothetical protein
MQGLCFRVLPAAWNHARTLMPSHSKNRGPSSSMAAQVRDRGRGRIRRWSKGPAQVGVADLLAAVAVAHV